MAAFRAHSRERAQRATLLARHASSRVHARTHLIHAHLHARGAAPTHPREKLRPALTNNLITSPWLAIDVRLYRLIINNNR